MVIVAIIHIHVGKKNYLYLLTDLLINKNYNIKKYLNLKKTHMKIDLCL